MKVKVSRPSRAARAVVLAAVASIGCSDRIGPGTIAFTVEPTDAVAGEEIDPAIEVTVRDAFGDPSEGTVTLSLDPNPCNWPLSGSLSAPLEGGVARFRNVTLDKIGRGYTLRAALGTLATTSRPFDVTSPITANPIVHVNLLCTKPNNQSDAESLTWVPEDDAFWIADDERVGIYQVDRRTGQTLSAIPSSDFAAALPSATTCDDGDGDPGTTCSYLDEFEQVAYDPTTKLLYIVNTVNSVADRPAIFRLRKEACAGCFTIEDWQPLPIGPSYDALATVNGELFVTHGSGIYGYDYATNRVATVDANGDSLPPQYAAASGILGLAFDGSSMWILTQQRILYEVQWSTKAQLAQYNLGPFSIATPKGLETVGDTVYVVEGDTPQPINVFVIQ